MDKFQEGVFLRVFGYQILLYIFIHTHTCLKITYGYILSGKEIKPCEKFNLIPLGTVYDTKGRGMFTHQGYLNIVQSYGLYLVVSLYAANSH